MLDVMVYASKEIGSELARFGYLPLDEGGGDRHGAWEWVWVKPRGKDGHCYVSLAVVESAAELYSLEVWAGADDGAHFGRHLVAQFPACSESKLWDLRKGGVLQRSVEQAAEVAAELPDSILTDIYLAERT